MAKKNQKKSTNSNVNKNQTVKKDKKYDEVKIYTLTQETITNSQIQKEFNIGYKRAKIIIDALEADKIIGAKDGTQPRVVLNIDAKNEVVADTEAGEEEVVTTEEIVETDEASEEEVVTDEEIVEADEASEEEEVETTEEIVEADEASEEEVETTEEIVEADEASEEIVADENEVKFDQEKSIESDESITSSEKILSIKEIAIGLGVIIALIIAMAVSNNFSQSREEQQLIDQYTLPIRASFSNEVKKDAIEENDVAIVSFVGYIDGQEVENTTANKARIIVGQSNIVDKFDENLIGHKKGDKFDSILTFPEDYPASELAGKEITFKVSINNVFKLRELDDSLVKEVAKEGKKSNNSALAKLKTVEDLENLIKEQIEMQKQIEQYSQNTEE